VIIEVERKNDSTGMARKQPRLRVLVCAQAVSPVRGSEPGVGWNIVSRLAQWHDVTVLCKPASHGSEVQIFRDEIETYIAQHGSIPGLTVHFVESPLLCQALQHESGLRRRTLYYVGYKAWQKKAYKAALMLHAEQPFNLIHHLNITGFREPGYLWKLSVPFIWGPVTGAADIPPSYFPMMGWGDRVFYTFRNIRNTMQKFTNIRCRTAARSAKHIWAVGRESMDLINGIWGCHAESLLESGASTRDGVSPRLYHQGRPLRIVWSGQHIGRKALPILLYVLKRLRNDPLWDRHYPPAIVTVLGSGPETERWQAVARELGLDDCVEWSGQVTQSTAMGIVAQADVLVHTSLQEGTPHVILEALSLGLPVVCHDICGMSVAVDKTCGIKVPMRDPESSILGFTDAIRNIILHPEVIERMSAGAIVRAEELSWDNKAWHIAQRYWQVFELASSKLPIIHNARGNW